MDVFFDNDRGGDCVELRQKILGNCCVNRISHKSQARLKLSPFHFHSKPWTGGGQIGRLVREQSLTCVCKSCAHLLLNKKPSWLKAGDSSIGLSPPYQQSNFPCSNRSNLTNLTLFTPRHQCTSSSNYTHKTATPRTLHIDCKWGVFMRIKVLVPLEVYPRTNTASWEAGGGWM